MKFPLYIGNFGWRIGCRIQDGCRTNPALFVFFVSFPLLFWPQSHAFSCISVPNAAGNCRTFWRFLGHPTASSFFHYHDERRRLRNFVDANTTWILAMAKCCDLLKFLYLCWCSYNGLAFVNLNLSVVICWNFCTFAGAVTTVLLCPLAASGCDLLKFLYLCWCSYNKFLP